MDDNWMNRSMNGMVPVASAKCCPKATSADLVSPDIVALKTRSSSFAPSLEGCCDRALLTLQSPSSPFVWLWFSRL